MTTLHPVKSKYTCFYLVCAQCHTFKMLVACHWPLVPALSLRFQDGSQAWGSSWRLQRVWIRSKGPHCKFCRAHVWWELTSWPATCTLVWWSASCTTSRWPTSRLSTPLPPQKLLHVYQKHFHQWIQAVLVCNDFQWWTGTEHDLSHLVLLWGELPVEQSICTYTTLQWPTWVHESPRWFNDWDIVTLKTLVPIVPWNCSCNSANSKAGCCSIQPSRSCQCIQNWDGDAKCHLLITQISWEFEAGHLPSSFVPHLLCAGEEQPSAVCSSH